MNREYVIRCEHTSGDVWTPVGLYAIDGEEPRVVRCRDCAHHDGGNCCTLLEFCTVGIDAGFCAWGAPREEE